MQWVRNHQRDPEQQRLYRVAIFITFGGNLLLAVGKGIVAYVSGSAAVYADAANSVSDVVYSVLMVLGLSLALRPPDLSHPQGHSRYEPLVGLVVTASMAFAGFEAARNAISRYMQNALEPITLDLPVIILLASALIKVFMYLAIRRISKRILSPTLATTARDNLSDVLSSLAAFLGVLGSNLIHPLADPIAGLVVAAWIFRNAFLAGRENLGFLTGRGATREEVEAFISVAESVPGVLKVHHIMTDYVGPRLMVDLHINVDGQTSLRNSHEISDEVIRRLEAFANVDRAYVHIEPDDWKD
ncbi:MAG: cation diffusion facilitator family transporter [Anaerolineaceae bacterium]|jgi:cation diffusion facilitator family transporter